MGYAVGMYCVKEGAEAAARFCGSVLGTSAGGTHSCTAASFNAGAVDWTLTVDTGTGYTDRAVSTPLAECTVYDVEYFAPVFGVFLLALVTVACARSILRMVRKDRESY